MNKYAILASSDFIFFTTRRFALHYQLSIGAATQQLKRMAERKLIIKIVRGIWANIQHPHFTILGSVPYLLCKEQGYVSFLTALNYYSLISQIPQIYQIATTGHTRKISTPIGDFEFHQMKPDMMIDGVVWSETKCPYRIATPEKALLDTFYLSTRKGKRFISLPEIHLSKENFNKKRFHTYLKKIKNTKIRKAIKKKSLSFS